ncbi:endonuclease/exonuclease/phosphatase family protein [Breznakibacter xylanolyticus]|uniref:endonuclease/exonuclease/phosphatase family protein n=1 Tax=Breznakibacter xylanolyticus TaxID=990 RepID=UPI000DAEEF8D|nr:endonuclease/exonuclease/phosphatase family protein [Breznakibacter xylanolyticus]
MKTSHRIIPFRAILIAAIMCLFTGSLVAQAPFSVMFYNTENLFDPWDDTTSTGDNEYLPDSPRHWNFGRYKTKLHHIAKTIVAAGQWEPPTLVGLCEVENATVLKHLIGWTGLSEINYRFVHFDSPDGRGIDVALLYRHDRFTPIESHPVKVNLPDGKPTRDILLVKGIVDGTDTLWVMVNHWPSRFGGAEASAHKRIAAANRALALHDSITAIHPRAYILMMGDFNDSPADSSLQRLSQSAFFNLYDIQENKQQGTNKYRQHWETIDQMLITPAMREGMQHIHYRVADLPFLLIDDETYMGKKLHRTYIGPRYQGGFSDHLPVIGTFSPRTGE